jgi:hypothetical protein
VLARLQQVKSANPDTVTVFRQVQVTAPAGGRIFQDGGPPGPAAEPNS